MAESLGKEIKITVDNEQTKSLALELAQEKLKNDKLADKIVRTNLSDPDKETLKEENEDLRNKLSLIAEKQFEKKRQEVGAPPEIDTPEKLQGFVAAKTKRETPSGSAPLNRQQYGGGSEDSIWTRKFSSGEAMVKALEQVANDKSNLEESKKATFALKQLWAKNVQEWKASGKATQLIPNRDESIPKRDGDVESQEADFGNQLESETKRIVGPSFKPNQHNYSKTHSQGGQKIGE